MNLFALITLCVPLVQAPVGALNGDESSVLRTYDLRALVPDRSSDFFEFQAFPLVHDEMDGWMQLGSEQGLDNLTGMILTVFEEEFEYEGRELHEDGSGNLVVRGPEHLQRRIADLLHGVSNAMWSTTEVTVDVVRGRELPERLARSSVLDASEVVSYLEGASEAGVLERFQLRVGSGRPAIVDVGERATLLIDYDVEVAEGSLISDPTLWDIELGNRMALRVAPGPGGMYLALALRRILPMGDVRVEQFAMLSNITLDSTPTEHHRRLAFQRQDVAHRSLALSSFLPDGKVLVVSSRLGSLGKGAGEVLVLRRTGTSLSNHATILGGDGVGDVHLVDGSSVHPPRCVSNLNAETLPDLPESIPTNPRIGWELRFGLTNGSQEEQPLQEFLYNGLHGDENMVEVSDLWPWLYVLRAPKGQASVATIQDQLAQLMPSPELAQVHLTLRDGGVEGPVLASMSVPARVGAHTSAVLGTERQLLHDVDVEIAKYASIEDPILRHVFEGLVVDFIPRGDGRGGVVLDLRVMAAQADGDLREVEPSSGHALQQAPTRELIVREILRFSDDAPGGRQVAIGDAAGSLVLEVAVD